MGIFQHRHKVYSLDFVFVLGCCAQLNKWHLRVLSVVLCNNSPTFDPLATCSLLCRFFFLLILVGSTRGVPGWEEGFNAESLYNVFVQIGAHLSSYSNGYSFQFVSIM